jgi:hypothetical protein
MQQWLIGYGSLMNQDSAQRILGPDIKFIPVVLPGWQRDFNLAISNSLHYRCRICAGGRQGIAAADAQPATESFMAAMAIKVSEAQLIDADQREISYQRVQVTNKSLPLKGSVWIYQGLAKHRNGAKVLPKQYWQMIAQAAELHPSRESILKEAPKLPLADLEFIRYKGKQVRGICSCADIEYS